MEYSPPPFFKQGPSARARLLFFASLAIALLVVDARFKTLTTVRQVVGTLLFPVEQVALVPRDAALNIGAYFSNQSTLLRETEKLRREALTLAQTSQRSQHLEAENTQLRRLLDARARVPVKSIHAEILYEARDPFSQKVIINRGSRDSVTIGQPVVDDKGVIGQIVRTSPFTSEVTLVTDREQTTPVQVLRNNLRAIAYGGPGPGAVELRFMAANADVVNGDVLVTSGLDGVYPAGIPVAKVLNVVRGPSAFAQITAEPMAGVARSTHVLVLFYTSPAADIAAAQAAAPAPVPKHGGGPR